MQLLMIVILLIKRNRLKLSGIVKTDSKMESGSPIFKMEKFKVYVILKMVFLTAQLLFIIKKEMSYTEEILKMDLKLVNGFLLIQKQMK